MLASFWAGNRKAAAKRRHVTSLPVYFWTVQQHPNYVVVYRPGTQPLEIVRVLHGMRDLKRLLES